MKTEVQKSFTTFENLPIVDPAVESLLGQGQRRQMESHLPQKERSRKKKNGSTPKRESQTELAWIFQWI
jgi:hypothetical protein